MADLTRLQGELPTMIVGADATGSPTNPLAVDSLQRANVISPDAAPATQNITVQDTVSATASGANSQSFITGTPTANSTALFALSSYVSVVVQVTGTWTGTLMSEVSEDGGTTWFTRGLKQSGTSYVSNSFTANFQGVLSSVGMTHFRVRATAAMTGTATVKVTLSNGVESVTVTNPIMLKDSTTQSITNTIKAASTAAAATDTAIVVAISPNNSISTKTSLTASAPTFATVGVSSAQAVASNANRKGLVLINTSINKISFAVGATAVLNSGITLYPGGEWVMDEYTFTTGAIDAIAGAASSNLTVQEFTT